MPLRICKTARISLAVGTSRYTTGDALGTQISFTVPESGIIRSVIITDVDDEANVDIKVWLFDSRPAVIAANAPFVLANADAEKLIGVLSLTAASQQHDGINGRIKYLQTAATYHSKSGVLWLQCEVEDGTPTYATTNDVAIQLAIEY